MSKYTTEVRYICESNAGLDKSVGAHSVDEVISKSLENIFNFDFPIFDENYRKVLEAKILKHFYTREIGEETVGLWKLRLNTKLNEIMPYYNKLYNSELIEFNPLYTKNITRSGNNAEQGDINSEGTNGGTNWNLYSDTPQGGLSGVDNMTYLTNATKNTISNNNSNSISNHTTENYLENIVGFDGASGSELLQKYRKTFLNIDLQIIEELEVLFMQLW